MYAIVQEEGNSFDDIRFFFRTFRTLSPEKIQTFSHILTPQKSHHFFSDGLRFSVNK